MGHYAEHTDHALGRCWIRRAATLHKNLAQYGPRWMDLFDGQALVDQLQEMLKLQEEQCRRLALTEPLV